jgi:hypothetical protein
MLYAGTEGDQGFVEKNNRVEFIPYDKITVKMSWQLFAKALVSLCDTLKIMNSLAI